MIGLVMLGIGVWRTTVLPKWGGALLVLGAIAFFLYQGPGGAVVSVLPLIGNLTAGVCFLLAFPVAGLRLWQGDATAG